MHIYFTHIEDGDTMTVTDTEAGLTATSKQGTVETISRDLFERELRPATAAEIEAFLHVETEEELAAWRAAEGI